MIGRQSGVGWATGPQAGYPTHTDY